MPTSYKKINHHILSLETKQNLVKFILDNPELVIGYYVSPTGEKTYSSTPIDGWKQIGLKKIEIEHFQEIVRKDVEHLEKIITIPFSQTVLYTNPYGNVPSHTDSRISERQCSIMVPLYPDLKEYQPTLFWPNYPDRSHYETLSGQDCPALVNLQTHHSMSNNGYIRFNFQIYFGLPYTYEIVSQMIDAGTLFRE